MKFVQARNYTKADRERIDLVVIHDMEYPEKPSAAEWCADFFAGPNAPKASAHYCVDNDSVVQCVRDEHIAWHAPGANHNGIGIEHAGYAKQSHDEWLDAYGLAMLEMSAGLVARLCRDYDIPVVRPSVADLKTGARGIVGHKDCTDAFSGGKGHWDPGPGFPWEWYLDRVRERLALLSAPLAVFDSPPGEWPVVEHDGARFSVSPICIWPVSLGQAVSLAEEMGAELPSPGLVDAIWRAADLRINMDDMVFTARQGNDFTPRTMASTTTFNERASILQSLVGEASFKLLAGYCKDVVRHNGKVGLYGGHRIDGTVIQDFYAGHALGWLDYSQGHRICFRLHA